MKRLLGRINCWSGAGLATNSLAKPALTRATRQLCSNRSTLRLTKPRRADGVRGMVRKRLESRGMMASTAPRHLPKPQAWPTLTLSVTAALFHMKPRPLHHSTRSRLALSPTMCRQLSRPLMFRNCPCRAKVPLEKARVFCRLPPHRRRRWAATRVAILRAWRQVLRQLILRLNGRKIRNLAHISEPRHKPLWPAKRMLIGKRAFMAG